MLHSDNERLVQAADGMSGGATLSEPVDKSLERSLEMSNELKAAALIAAAQICRLDQEPDLSKRIYWVAHTASRLIEQLNKLEEQRRVATQTVPKSKGR